MKVSLATAGGTTILTLKGDIAEKLEAAFVEVEPRISGDRVVLDLEGVSRMNSYGVRELINILGRLRNGRRITFTNCPPAFIDFCNMVQMIEASEVESFYVPGFCTRCAESHMILVKSQNARGDFPPLVCIACNGELTPEVEAEDFLEFLKA